MSTGPTFRVAPRSIEFHVSAALSTVCPFDLRPDRCPSGVELVASVLDPVVPRRSHSEEARNAHIVHSHLVRLTQARTRAQPMDQNARDLAAHAEQWTIIASGNAESTTTMAGYCQRGNSLVDPPTLRQDQKRFALRRGHSCCRTMPDRDCGTVLHASNACFPSSVIDLAWRRAPVI